MGLTCWCNECYYIGAMVRRYELIDHTADIGIAAYGDDLEGAFASAAYALFSIIAELDGVGEDVSRDVEVDARDVEGLLVEWLNELIYIFDTENIIFKTFKIDEIGENNLRARCFGERVDLKRHHLKTGVKAATYHMVEVQKNDGVRVQVLLDV